MSRSQGALQGDATAGTLTWTITWATTWATSWDISWGKAGIEVANSMLGQAGEQAAEQAAEQAGDSWGTNHLGPWRCPSGHCWGTQLGNKSTETLTMPFWPLLRNTAGEHCWGTRLGNTAGERINLGSGKACFGELHDSAYDEGWQKESGQARRSQKELATARWM